MENSPNYFDQANQAFNEGHYERAIELYKMALSINHQHVNALINCGNAFFLLQRHEEAIEKYNAAIEVDSSFALVFYNRGMVKNALQRYHEAIEDYSIAISLDPNAFIFVNRGNTKRKAGDIQGAIDDYSAAIDLNPNFDQAYYNRAMAYSTIEGQSAAVLEDLKTAQRILKNAELKGLKS